jgi:hypothetical protein
MVGDRKNLKPTNSLHGLESLTPHGVRCFCLPPRLTEACAGFLLTPKPMKGERKMARKKSSSAKKKDEAKEPTMTLEVVTKESKKGKGAEKETQAQAGTKSAETPTAPKESVTKESEKGKATKPQKLTRIESTVQAYFAVSGKTEINKKLLAHEANRLYAESGGADNEKEALWASGYMLAFEDALKKYGHTLG